MAKERLRAVHVVERAKDRSQAPRSEAVNNATELDGVVAMYVVVWAKSNRQIQNTSR
jgi:hypothetical protein